MRTSLYNKTKNKETVSLACIYEHVPTAIMKS